MEEVEIRTLTRKCAGVGTYLAFQEGGGEGGKIRRGLP